MPCYHPIEGYRSRVTTMSGKRALVFNPKDGYVDLPVTVPCGACIGCRLDRARTWSIRLMHEASQHDLSIFVTLTYRPDAEPEGRSLVKSHFQSFMKRLRKSHGSKIRYFHCGEYGDTSARPHYHAILFGIDFADKVKHTTTPLGETLFSSETLEKIWGHGHCLIGSVTPESCNYVARYITKKVTGEKAKAHYETLNLATGEIYSRTPEYITMSLKPGIGADWFKRYASDVFPSDYVVERGKKTSVPKFYTRKHLQENPEAERSLKAKRIKQAALRKHDSTPERLAVRKEVKLAQISQLKRPI
ncbi:MAG: replication initiator protein [Microviridae sp.]|nr:MAG: replication initiator protein [Microviridae sp.]